MNRHDWKKTLLAAPGIAVSLPPKIAYPACCPACARLLSSVGPGLRISNTQYLLSLPDFLLNVPMRSLWSNGHCSP